MPEGKPAGTGAGPETIDAVDQARPNQHAQSGANQDVGGIMHAGVDAGKRDGGGNGKEPTAAAAEETASNGGGGETVERMGRGHAAAAGATSEDPGLR